MRYFMDSVYLWQVTWPTWLLSKLSTSSFWFGHRLCIIFQSCIIYIYCVLYIYRPHKREILRHSYRQAKTLQYAGRLCERMWLTILLQNSIFPGPYWETETGLITVGANSILMVVKEVS
jgi:hypothetical protein